MKKIFTMITVLTITLTAFATGYDHGNGGGVICINNKCQTLADSGLQVSPKYPNYWIPSSTVLQQINKDIRLFPFSDQVRNKIINSVLGNLTHFRMVEIVEIAKLDQIRDQYKKTISEESPDFDLTHFMIVALSDDDTSKDHFTYLLPDFLKLDINDQAKILIHEGLYRGRKSNALKFVLQFESAISVLTEPEKHKNKMPNIEFENASKYFVNAQIAAYKLNFLSKSELLGHLLYSTYKHFLTKISDYKHIYNPVNVELKYDAYLMTENDGLNLTPFFTTFSNSNNELFMDINKFKIHELSYLNTFSAVFLLNLGERIELNEESSTKLNNSFIFNYQCSSNSKYCLKNLDFKLETIDKKNYSISNADFLNIVLPGGEEPINTQPTRNYMFPNEANEIINWELSLMGKSEKIRFSGRTTNNLPCELVLTDLRKSGPIETNQFYLSLGTGATATTNYDNFTWIGTFIAPQYEYHELKITSTQVHFSKTEDAFPGSADYPAYPKHINDLVVFTNSRGLPIKAVGQSSHWPSSTCILN